MEDFIHTHKTFLQSSGCSRHLKKSFSLLGLGVRGQFSLAERVFLPHIWWVKSTKSRDFSTLVLLFWVIDCERIFYDLLKIAFVEKDSVLK